MIAVLTVFANHLWQLPRGGFVGVDVFFVISGFLITGNLLRMAETNGTVSFKTFYWNRIRRIVPAATVVLILTYLASTLVFLPFRSNHIGIDALFAFAFLSNWRFAIEGTDYFNAGEAVSPIQHYWSLSIEEQFYFVWPALIFIISLLVIRRGWTHRHRMQSAAVVMGVIVATSLGWAAYETASSPTWAYFNTFARVWELGIGALLATAVRMLARIPTRVKTLLSWTGLAFITASLVLISDSSRGFPAPWALLPVVGAALVIGAGVNGEPRYQALLRNPLSAYIGDISYSLYLVHWPVIVFLSSIMDVGLAYYITVLTLTIGLAIASYHFIESPLRRADRSKLREVLKAIRRRRYHPQRSTAYAALGTLTLLMAGLITYTVRSTEYARTLPPPVKVAAADSASSAPTLGPVTTSLQAEIIEALEATRWPSLSPTIESVINGPKAPLEVWGCGTADTPDPTTCAWGSPSAPVRAVLVGNSIGMVYAGPLREIALTSDGHFAVQSEAMSGCPFVDAFVTNGDVAANNACPGRKQHAIDTINSVKPQVVIVANSYNTNRVVGTDEEMTEDQWATSLQQIIEKFRNSTTKVVFLSPPPADADIRQCYAKRSSSPADCISRITSIWTATAKIEQDLAKKIGGIWIDSRPWFCNVNGTLCPSFVGTTPTKLDRVHMSPEYGHKIFPAIAESFRQAGIF